MAKKKTGCNVRIRTSWLREFIAETIGQSGQNGDRVVRVSVVVDKLICLLFADSLHSFHYGMLCKVLISAKIIV